MIEDVLIVLVDDVSRLANDAAPASRLRPRRPGARDRRVGGLRVRRDLGVLLSSAKRGRGPFYGSGRPLQTSIALDALAVAALQSGLPPHSDGARAAIVDERVRRAGVSVARIERNLRLPERLRARIDELVAAARERLPRVSRADLVNAALRDGLPPDAEQGAELVCEYARRLERAAVA